MIIFWQQDTCLLFLSVVLRSMVTFPGELEVELLRPNKASVIFRWFLQELSTNWCQFQKGAHQRRERLLFVNYTSPTLTYAVLRWQGSVMPFKRQDSAFQKDMHSCLNYKEGCSKSWSKHQKKNWREFLVLSESRCLLLYTWMIIWKADNLPWMASSMKWLFYGTLVSSMRMWPIET